MGRGFGRGAKAVAVVTHAQVKNAKKIPRGLKDTRKKRRRMYRREAAAEDPNSMMNTGDEMTNNKRNEGKTNSKKHVAPKSVEQQIAGIHFETLVPRGKKLKVLRKQLINTVKNIRRKDHKKKEARSKAEVRKLEKMEKRKKHMEERKVAAAKAGKKE